jgi:flagellar basal-body rod modification protein FlgD
MDGSGGSSAASSAGTATITANDFLTLLVTELKNQDPTANTDPNEYINQLVQVNSLEQLIQINQNTGPSSASGQPSGSSPAAPGAAAAGARQLPAAAPQPSPRSSAGSPPVVAGNLAAPPPSDRAAGVAQALGLDLAKALASKEAAPMFGNPLVPLPD